MTEKLNIVQSTTEPDKRNIWLKDNELKKFGAKGWSTIGGSNAGGGNGGTSTDKDTLDIYIDWDTKNVIIDDKVFVPEVNTNSGLSLIIRDEKLYSTLYSSLVNTNTVAYIKTIPTNEFQIFGIPSYISQEGNIAFVMILDGGFITLTIFNR